MRRFGLKCLEDGATNVVTKIWNLLTSQSYNISLTTAHNQLTKYWHV